MEYSFIATIFVLCLIAFYFGRVASKWQDFDFIEDFKKRGQIALLKPIYIFIAFFVGAHILILFFGLLGEILAIPTNNNVIDVRDLALAFIGSISAIGALFGVYLAILRSEENKRQNDTAEQGLITDRINKAVESLGKVDQTSSAILEVRIGALYALERIAQDSLRDHIRIMKIICAYIYVRKPLKNKEDRVSVPLSEDIRAALIIIGLRGEWTADQRHLKKEEEQKYRLDLRNCYLDNADLIDANLSKAWLNNVTLETASLVRAKLCNANLQNTNFTNTKLIKTDFKDAVIKDSFAYEGDFSKCLNLQQDQVNNMFLGKGIALPKDLIDTEKDLIHPQKGTKYYKKYNTFDDFFIAYKKWRDDAIQARANSVKETGN